MKLAMILAFGLILNMVPQAAHAKLPENTSGFCCVDSMGVTGIWEITTQAGADAYNKYWGAHEKVGATVGGSACPSDGSLDCKD